MPLQGLINEALDDAWVDEDDPAMHVEGAEQRMFLGCKFAWLTSLPYLASLHLMGIQKVPKVLQRMQEATQEAAQETLRTGGCLACAAAAAAAAARVHTLLSASSAQRACPCCCVVAVPRRTRFLHGGSLPGLWCTVTLAHCGKWCQLPAAAQLAALPRPSCCCCSLICRRPQRWLAHRG